MEEIIVMATVRPKLQKFQDQSVNVNFLHTVSVYENTLISFFKNNFFYKILASSGNSCNYLLSA